MMDVLKVSIRKAVRCGVFWSLILSMPLAAQQAAQPAYVNFTDSAARMVQVPRQPTKLVPSGPLAQIFLYTLAPHLLVGWSTKPTTDFLSYLPPGMQNLPVFGQFYGAASTLNTEALISANPDLIIDIGERKPTIVQDMDDLQSRTGIPTVFIEAGSFDSYAKTYRDLGRLLRMEARAEQLARFAESTVEYFKNLHNHLARGRGKVRVYYGEDVSGLVTIAAGSLHSQTMEFAGLINVANLSQKGGTGRNQVSMEQLLLWDPDLIILTYGAKVSELQKDPLFRQLRAVQQGRIYDVPVEPFNWIARPPSINRLVGLYWLAYLAYPDLVSRQTLEARVREFYALFYHTNLRDADLGRLIR